MSLTPHERGHSAEKTNAGEWILSTLLLEIVCLVFQEHYLDILNLAVSRSTPF